VRVAKGRPERGKLVDGIEHRDTLVERQAVELTLRLWMVANRPHGSA